MKLTSMISLALVTACILSTGCNKASDTTTTPGGKGFELSDVGNLTIKQTESDTVRVAIDRKGGFDGEVTVEVTGLPAGVSVDGGNRHVILAKDSAVSLKLLASDTAAPTEKNEVTVKVSAMVDGKDLSKRDNFNLTVKPRT